MSDSTSYRSFSPEAMFGVEFNGRSNLNVFCPFCEDERSSRTPSCSVSDRGLFTCKVCGARGSGVSFYARKHNLTKLQAVEQLRLMDEGRSDAPLIKPAKIKGKLDESLPYDCHDMLMQNSSWLLYLQNERGLLQDTIERFLIGCDEYRITIPIFIDGELVNVRRYLPHATGTTPKMVTHANGDGRPVLYPLEVVQGLSAGSQLIVCEGEWDCLLLNQNGFNAITNTGNCKVWNHAWHEWLLGYELVFIYDVNDQGPPQDLGQVAARQRAREFTKLGGRCKVVRLPLEDRGGDITDYFVKYGHSPSSLRELIDTTPYFDQSMAKDDPSLDETDAQLDDLLQVDLFTASDGSNLNKAITFRAVVAGRGSAPFLYPKKFDYVLEHADETTESGTQFVNAWDPDILQLVGRSTSAQMQAIRARLKAPKSSKLKVEILESGTLEEIFLIPPLDHQTQASVPYCLRKCYFHGHGLSTNRTYEFVGFTAATPDKQESTQVLVEAQPSFTEIDNFQLDDSRAQELRDVFSASDPHAKIEEIAVEMSQHVTKIFGRDDLHIAVDLVFHSVNSFVFDGVLVRKGWLECLIVGDTRTGKGFVTEGLCRHYQLGEVVSAENLTFAGLIGGVQRVGDRWTLTWGKIPLADRRLVVLDECSSLSLEAIGKLSRVRSEGVAEVTKVITEATNARTRLIWISNPRSASRSIKDYNYGIDCVPELIGSPEDVARFDYALVVSRDEVPTKVINSKQNEVHGTQIYRSDLCRDLILWCWSRATEQIKFDEKAVGLIYKAAKALGHQFTSKICLIQHEDVRFKLARLACAIAGRTFSTSDGHDLLVHSKHVDFAYNFLCHIYGTSANGYERLSQYERRNAEVKDPEEVQRRLRQDAGDAFEDLVDGLQSHSIFAAQDVSDFSGLDPYTTRNLLSFLVRSRCLDKAHHSQYRKRPAFRRLLSSLQVDDPISQGE